MHFKVSMTVIIFARGVSQQLNIVIVYILGILLTNVTDFLLVIILVYNTFIF